MIDSDNLRYTKIALNNRDVRKIPSLTLPAGWVLSARFWLMSLPAMVIRLPYVQFNAIQSHGCLP